MSEAIDDAVETFLDEAEKVFGEYDDGYMDADAALELLGDHVSELRDTYEGE